MKQKNVETLHAQHTEYIAINTVFLVESKLTFISLQLFTCRFMSSEMVWSTLCRDFR